MIPKSTISPGIAPVYEEKVYSPGECVLHMNRYWKCITRIDTPENWTQDHWIEVTDIVMRAVSALRPSDFSAIQPDLIAESSSIAEVIDKLNAVIRALKGQ